MLRGHARIHAWKPIIHHVGGLSCHRLRSPWGRRTAEYVMERSISLMVGLAARVRVSGTIIAGLGRTIVCHAQSRDSRSRRAWKGFDVTDGASSEVGGDWRGLRGGRGLFPVAGCLVSVPPRAVDSGKTFRRRVKDGRNAGGEKRWVVF